MHGTIQIHDVSVKAFNQYLDGRRKSVMIQLAKEPEIGEHVKLHIIQTTPPQPQPHIINTQVTNFIHLSCFLSTQRYYSLILDL